MKKIIIATGNAGKVKEFKEMFATAGLDVCVTSLAEHFDPVPDIVEDGATFYDNAKIKADWLFDRLGGEDVWTLADDSGLEVDALNGAPGVFSARYSDMDDTRRGGPACPPSSPNVPSSSPNVPPSSPNAPQSVSDVPQSVRNNEKLLRELKDVPEGRRTARFRCVLVLKTGGGEYHTADGACEGRIISEAMGEKGFGYDPLFIPDGYDKTFAQLGAEEKNAISHRGRALKKLCTILRGIL